LRFFDAACGALGGAERGGSRMAGTGTFAAKMARRARCDAARGRRRDWSGHGDGRRCRQSNGRRGGPSGALASFGAHGHRRRSGDDRKRSGPSGTVRRRGDAVCDDAVQEARVGMM
jgi:hypothetical protein